MADKIGVARRWYQGDHYDVCMSKRALAVRCGAVEITLRELAQKSRELKQVAVQRGREGSNADPPR